MESHLDFLRSSLSSFLAHCSLLLLEHLFSPAFSRLPLCRDNLVLVFGTWWCGDPCVGITSPINIPFLIRLQVLRLACFGSELFGGDCDEVVLGAVFQGHDGVTAISVAALWLSLFCFLHFARRFLNQTCRRDESVVCKGRKPHVADSW